MKCINGITRVIGSIVLAALFLAIPILAVCSIVFNWEPFLCILLVLFVLLEFCCLILVIYNEAWKGECE